MATGQEPPVKKPVTDFQLCLFCQIQTSASLVNTEYRSFKDSAYKKILECIQKKAEYGNPDFVNIAQHLSGVTPEEIKDRKGSWHTDCYKKNS